MKSNNTAAEKFGSYVVKTLKKGFTVSYPDGTRINLTRNRDSIKFRHNNRINVTDISYPVSNFRVSTNEHRKGVANNWRVNLLTKDGLVETFSFDRRSEARDFRSEVACALGIK